MFKKINLLLLGVAALLISIPTSAQVQKRFAVTAQPDSVVIMGNLIQAHPYNSRTHEYDDLSPSNVGIVSLKKYKDSENGLDEMAFVVKNHVLYGDAGAVYCDSVFYTFHQHESSDYTSEESTYSIVVRGWSTKDWSKLSEQEFPSNSGLNATDMCYDPIDDRIYGIFNMIQGSDNGYRLGTLDVKTMKVTPISKNNMDMEIRALAVSPEGVLYGIASSGDFYRIDKMSGIPTLIGNVGFKTQRKRMSATFDQRTGRLYWLGFKNSGIDESTRKNLTISQGREDTGLFEIDLTTGKATLLADMPNKEVVVGAWIDGGDVKQSYDLKVELSAPSQIKVGQKGSFTAYVKNLGIQVANGYKVKLYCNDKEVASVDGVDLAAEADKYYTLNFTPTISDKADSKFYAAIVDAKDTVLRNNFSVQYDVKIILPVYPAVTLYGKRSAEGNVLLKWEAPNLDAAIVDGAEDYAAFSIDNVGDWTMFDGDQAYTVVMNFAQGTRTYPNAGRQMAFQVFNPLEAGLSLEGVDGAESQFAPYAGSQVFAAFASGKPSVGGGDPEMVQNDDWMISPELSGKEQTIKFVAQSYASMGYMSDDPVTYTEKMLVYYSTGGTDIDEFMQVGDTISVPDNWTEFSFNVPAGAKHFALRCVSFDQFFLFVDNIQYQGKAYKLQGYNVYRNGEKVNAELLSEPTFSEIREPNATDTYNVTVVYAEGESAYSNEVVFTSPTAIDDVINTKTKDMQLFDLMGRRVSGKLKSGVYVRNGKKVVIK